MDKRREKRGEKKKGTKSTGGQEAYGNLTLGTFCLEKNNQSPSSVYSFWEAGHQGAFHSHIISVIGPSRFSHCLSLTHCGLTFPTSEAHQVILKSRSSNTFKGRQTHFIHIRLDHNNIHIIQGIAERSSHTVADRRTCWLLCHSFQPKTLHFLKTCNPNLSISLPSLVFRPAASKSLAHDSASRILTASSAALTRRPHFSYIVIDCPGSRFVHLGIKTAARRGLPA